MTTQIQTPGGNIELTTLGQWWDGTEYSVIDFTVRCISSHRLHIPALKVVAEGGRAGRPGPAPQVAAAVVDEHLNIGFVIADVTEWRLTGLIDV